jgi:hypothetical protein
MKIGVILGVRKITPKELLRYRNNILLIGVNLDFSRI